MVERRDRNDPELVKFFDRARTAWREGRIRLTDFVEGWKELPNGSQRPLWYANPLGSKVPHDKAAFFEQIGYRPNLPAARFHASLAKVKVYSGGARSGKSLAAGVDVCPALISPNVRIWLVGPEYEQCQKEFDYILSSTVEHKAVGPLIKSHVTRVSNRPHQGDMEIRLNFGDAGESFVKVKSTKNLRSLLSEELDIVMVVEAAEVPQVAWKRYLTPRLITRKGIAIFPSSPSGMGWVSELYNLGIEGKPGYFAVNADTRMNPTVSLEEVAFWNENMSDEDWSEQVEGKPAPKFGLVYPGFDKEIHVRSWQDDWPKASWKRGRAIDFGYTDPFVCLWIAEDEDRRLYVYRELYKSHLLMDQVVERIADAEGWETNRDDAGRISLVGHEGKKEAIRGSTIGDWDASGRAELAVRGIRIRKAKKDIIAGVRTVANLLRIKKDGRPRLFVHPSCTALIREFTFYEWAEKSETPKAGDDHAMDALRYFAHTTQPFQGSLKVRTLTYGGAPAATQPIADS